jgi:hypothetical protein
MKNKNPSMELSRHVIKTFYYMNSRDLSIEVSSFETLLV